MRKGRYYEKMNFTFKYLILFLYWLPFFVKGLPMSPMVIYGKIKKYDEKYAVLSTNNGMEVKISKESIIKDFKKMKTGLCVVAHVDVKDVENIIRNKEK